MFKSIYKFKLKNGIPVHYIKNKNKNTSIIINFNIGSLWENTKEKGIAHLVEHLMFKESYLYTTEQLLNLLEINGAKVNASTGFTDTNFYFTCNNDVFENTLKIMIEMLKSKSISKQEFEKEKSVVIQELRSYNDDSKDKNFNNWYKITYGVDPVVGFEKIIKNITLEEVYKWINRHITIENMSIYITTQIPKSKIKNMLNKYLNNFRSYSHLTIEYIEKSARIYNFSHNSKIFSYIEDKQNQQVNILIGYFLNTNISNINNYIKLEVLNDMLDKGLTSILFREIREKHGYCYSINSSIDTFENKNINNKIPPVLLINTSCEPRYVNKCISEINKVIKNLSKKIKKSDLEKVNNFKTLISNNNNNIYNLDNYIYLNNVIENYDNFNKDNILKLYKSVTIDEIIQFINNSIDIKNKNISICGPKYKNKEYNKNLILK